MVVGALFPSNIAASFPGTFVTKTELRFDIRGTAWTPRYLIFFLVFFGRALRSSSSPPYTRFYIQVRHFFSWKLLIVQYSAGRFLLSITVEGSHSRWRRTL